MNIVALAGGVGGAKLADGLSQVLPPENLTVVVNSGDDFEHLGLYICPDIDTVCYTLAGVANPLTGWGLVDETWHALGTLENLGGPTWFQLGDRDLGLHLERTRRLRMGHPLSQIIRDFCIAMGVHQKILPMCDEYAPTYVQTEEGDLPFQEYFVKRECSPLVNGFNLSGVDAKPAPGVLQALQAADLIILCPSNPWVSIDPILAVPGIRQTLESRTVIAVSPIIGGKAVKGPAAKMFNELGIQPCAFAVAQHYSGLIKGFVLDNIDFFQVDAIEALDVKTFVTATLMKTQQDRVRLASEVIEFGFTLS